MTKIENVSFRVRVKKFEKQTESVSSYSEANLCCQFFRSNFVSFQF
jgi:hypothetical protein